MTAVLETILRQLAMHVEEATILNEGWTYKLEWKNGSIMVTQSKSTYIA
jgi:hypothetical protein